MNRAERRKYVKNLNTPEKLEQYSMKMSSELKKKYEELYEKKFKKELGQSIDYFILAIVYTLHFNEKTQFGNARIEDFMDDLLETVDNFRTGTYNPQEYMDQLKNEGINVVIDNRKGE